MIFRVVCYIGPLSDYETRYALESVAAPGSLVPELFKSFWDLANWARTNNATLLVSDLIQYAHKRE